MADTTPEQYSADEVARANRISAWAAEQARKEVDAKRAAYRAAMRPVVSDASWTTVRAALRDVIASTPADDNMAIHVTALAATMDRINAEPM